MKERKKMTRSISTLGLAIVLSLAVACGEEPIQEVREYSPQEEQRASSALVTPVFQVSGVDMMPESLILDKLGLVITEVRLSPLGEDSGGVAYATTNSFELLFDLSNGEQALERGTVEIPKTGRFMVGIRVEPGDGGGEFLLPDGRVASIGLEGRVRHDGRRISEAEDGKPLPLPFDERRVITLQGDEEGDPDPGEEGDGKPLPLPFERLAQRVDSPMVVMEQWTSFRYTSQDQIFFTFTEVNLVEGEQKLVFDFDLKNWLGTLQEPIESAVAQGDHRSETLDGPVDISAHLDARDSMDFHLRGLLEEGQVFNMPLMP